VYSCRFLILAFSQGGNSPSRTRVINKDKGPFLLFYEHFYIIAVVTAVALVAAYFVTGSMEPAYRSQARCFMPAQTNTVSLSTEEGNVPNSPLLPTANADFQDSLLGILQGADTRALVATRIEGRDSAWLKKNVEFGIDRFNLITISAFDPDPKMALAMAEQYLLAFQQKLDDTTKAQAKTRLETFSKGITDSGLELEKLQKGRLDFMREHGAIDFEAELAEVGTRQVAFEADVVRYTTSIATAERQLIEIQKQIGERPERIESASTTVNNPAVEQLDRNLIEVKRELANLRTQYTDEHPLVVAKLLDVELLETEKAAEEARILGTSTNTPDSLSNTLTGQQLDLEQRLVGDIRKKEVIEAELEKTKARRIELSVLKSQLDSMDTDIRSVRGNLVNYRERQAELEVYMSRNSTFLVIPEFPAEPNEPYFPIMWVNLLVAAILGITVGVGLVIVITNIRTYREAALW
jgi:uncharacterized protein involved in exopolysaccharide biosynthesis